MTKIHLQFSHIYCTHSDVYVKDVKDQLELLVYG